ncbi:MAG: hypothetical protein R3C10_23310 [Pirellulales bacterium]
MGSQVSIAKVPVYPVLIVVSFLVGYFIPGFYDWTGSDQSRPSPLVGKTAAGLLVGATLIWAILPWVPVADDAPGAQERRRIQFTSRTLLLLTTAIAIVLAVATRFPMVVSSVLCALAFCHVVWFWIRSHSHRWQTTALLACLGFPFVWVLFHDELDNLFPAILWLAAGLPAFLPAALIGSLFGQNMNDVIWLAVLLTGAELAVGTWLIRLGPRRTIAYLVLVLLLSTFGSFGQRCDRPTARRSRSRKERFVCPLNMQKLTA